MKGENRGDGACPDCATQSQTHGCSCATCPQSERALAACTLAVSHLAACVAEARALATRASEQQRVDLTVASQAVDLEAWGRLQVGESFMLACGWLQNVEWMVG